MPTLRPRIRLTLGGLMVLVACLAVVLGSQVKKARLQREAVAAVKRHGGWVHYDYEMVEGKPMPGRGPEGPRWLRRIIGDEYFQTIVGVNFVFDAEMTTGNPDERPCDDALAALATQGGLREVLLQGGQATDEGLRHVGRLTRLKGLFMNGSAGVTDAGIEHISHLENLNNLVVISNKVTDKKLSHISKMKNLTYLAVGSDNKVRSLITNEGIASIASLRDLTSLSIINANLTDEGFRQLQGLTKLETLILPGCHVSDEGLTCLTRCKGLLHLSLEDTNVSDAGLMHLEGLSNLRSLNLKGTRCSSEGKDKFQKDNPSVTYMQ